MNAKLLCAACLSIGSHYGQYLLGPLKQTLHTSEHAFASLISAQSLINTITPLVSGFFVQRWGAGWTGITACLVVLVGQLIVAVGQFQESVNLMIFGMFVFGIGIAPLAVVQESIVLKETSHANKSKSVALILLLGKLFSWLASITAVPLSQCSTHLPFLVSSLFSAISLSIACHYNRLERSIPDRKEEFHTFTSINYRQILNFGDLFWCYALLCILCGATWFPFIHYSSSFLQTTFQIETSSAATTASLITFMAIVLYPLVGTLIDIWPEDSIFGLYTLSSNLTMATFLFLLSPTWRSRLGYIGCTLPFAIGYGYVPLVLVITASKVVEIANIPVVLGIHKTLEMAGASIMQNLAGIVLEGGGSSPQLKVLSMFTIANGLHLGMILFFWRTAININSTASQSQEYAMLPTDYSIEDAETHTEKQPKATTIHKLAMIISIGSVLLAWAMFIGELVT